MPLRILEIVRRQMSTSNEVCRSYSADVTPIVKYCADHSCRLDPVQSELFDETVKNDIWHVMLSTPEVLELGKQYIHLTGAKRVLDIGTYTGFSAFAWALAIPEDGKVLTIDISHESLDQIGRPIMQKRPDIYAKIEFQLHSAVRVLDELISSGNDSWDFAFIDADKEHYPVYYEKCVQLLRPGGVILVDNALFFGNVIQPQDREAKAIARMNDIIFADDRTLSTLINVGDGLHIAIKK